MATCPNCNIELTELVVEKDCGGRHVVVGSVELVGGSLTYNYHRPDVDEPTEYKCPKCDEWITDDEDEAEGILADRIRICPA